MSLWRDLKIATDLLKAGTPVAVPTETVYGLAAPVWSSEAIRKVFELKARPFFDPLIVHVASISQVAEVAEELSGLALHLARTFWPGPLTIVLKKRPELDPTITSGLDTVGVRLPSHPIMRRLIKSAGAPLAAPSANRFGKTSPVTAAHVRSEWPGAEVFVVSGGHSQIGIESTVIEVVSDNEIEVLRPGFVSIEDLHVACKAYSPEAGAAVGFALVESKKSPGHLLAHYQPAIPLVILPCSSFPLSAERTEEIAGLLSARFERIIAPVSCNLYLDPNPALAARNLYSSLRTLAERGEGFITVEKRDTNQLGLWTAIWDRLSRAATLDLS